MSVSVGFFSDASLAHNITLFIVLVNDSTQAVFYASFSSVRYHMDVWMTIYLSVCVSLAIC